MEQVKETERTTHRDYAIFNVGDIACGVDIKMVREINRNIDITPVQLAPKYVRGVINLRGQIVTVIDMRKKFGMEVRELNKNMRILVVRLGDEDKGLLVDGVDDISTASSDQVELPPSHINSNICKYLSGVYKMEQVLVAIVDVNKILKQEDTS